MPRSPQLTFRGIRGRKVLVAMAGEPLKVGDLVACRVTDIKPMLIRLTAISQQRLGVVRGSAASRVSVGQHVHVRILDPDVGGRFEATLISG